MVLWMLALTVLGVVYKCAVDIEGDLAFVSMGGKAVPRCLGRRVGVATS